MHNGNTYTYTHKNTLTSSTLKAPVAVEAENRRASLGAASPSPLLGYLWWVEYKRGGK